MDGIADVERRPRKAVTHFVPGLISFHSKDRVPIGILTQTILDATWSP